MKRAILYARVSTDIQRGNYSIPTQIRACKEYIDTHGWALVGNRYVDRETGLDTQKGKGAIPAYVDDYTSRELSRPSLDEVFAYLDTYGFDSLVVYDIDRLARDPYYRQTIERYLHERGATVHYVQGNYDDSPEGEVRKDLEATFAKWENAKRVERITRGKLGKARRGLFVSGRPPYGYIMDAEAFGGLAVNEEQASIVVWIFEMYVNENRSIREITRILTGEEIPNHSGKTKWGKTSVAKILSNSTYNGTSYYNKFKQRPFSGGLEHRDKEEWVAIPVTPIVEPWLFDAAQAKLKENRVRRRKQSIHFYLFAGMITCAHCGKPYFSGHKKAGKNRRINDAAYYRHRRSNGHCANKVISERILEPKVWGKVVELLLNPESLREGYQQSVEEWQENMEHLHRHAATLHESVSKYEQQIQNLNLMYADPEVGLTRKEYLQSREQILSQLKEAEEHLAEIQSQIEEVPEPLEVAEFEAFTAGIREQLQGDFEPTPEQKRELMEVLHIQIKLQLDGAFKIEGWIAPAPERGLLSNTSAHCALLLLPPPLLV